MSQDLNQISLCSVHRDDLPKIKEMAEEIWPICYREIITAAQIQYMLNQMYSLEVLSRELSEEQVDYRWIEWGHQPIGFLAVGPSTDSARAILHKLYLLSEHQGKGLGVGAMEALFRHTKPHYRHLELRVNKSNSPAIRFYEKLGFHREREDVLTIGGGFVMDDYIMRRSLE
ncbi:MAG: GNAT family N-acetyltransferase [Verrucomicrobiota bacterium]